MVVMNEVVGVGLVVEWVDVDRNQECLLMILRYVQDNGRALRAIYNNSRKVTLRIDFNDTVQLHAIA